MDEGNIKLEETRSFAMVERAKLIVSEASDLGKDVYKLFAFCLIIAEIERARVETNEIIAKIKAGDTTHIPPVLIELVRLIVKDFDDEIQFGSLPSPDALEIMIPELLSCARTDIKFAADIIHILQIVKGAK